LELTLIIFKTHNYFLLTNLKFVKLFDLSKTIFYNSLGRIYKPASTLKDSFENCLKREGYVDAIIDNN
jgi:hypothetical protein